MAFYNSSYCFLLNIEGKKAFTNPSPEIKKKIAKSIIETGSLKVISPFRIPFLEKNNTREIIIAEIAVICSVFFHKKLLIKQLKIPITPKMAYTSPCMILIIMTKRNGSVNFSLTITKNE
jgi:hypothetical protein